MKNLAKRIVRPLVRRLGYDVVAYSPEKLGVDPLADTRNLLKGIASPTLFDVGANTGQTAIRFVRNYPAAMIHSFEPSPTTFGELEANCRPYPRVKCWNLGVGCADAVLTFLENDHSDMSSFLAPGDSCWGKVERRTDVPVVSLDSFAARQGINYIHLLKSDTQGFDFEVLKGAQRLMQEKRIGLIYFEFIFSDMYKDLPAFDQVFRYLTDHGFALVTFYDFHFQRDLASWTDALFISRDFHAKRISGESSA
jgi:FkbM family methyltransferase